MSVAGISRRDGMSLARGYVDVSFHVVPIFRPTAACSATSPTNPPPNGSKARPTSPFQSYRGSRLSTLSARAVLGHADFSSPRMGPSTTSRMQIFRSPTDYARFRWFNSLTNGAEHGRKHG